ncbi:uncharacterized protein BKA55DRAFT_562710 [Fusarium redolens]|uniref:Uncharacterized protein n=1 Tax=Fusarium redolens TaxID=48865 RepID=A0A9P9HLG3_FUSRE|nr:uncharacterized protein BKA55DRAFT_562710 [Fusarium redolens]KAH7259531.1 hypothetical protein BKA55DRAFT_562710 [Fusarium redolens]
MSNTKPIATASSSSSTAYDNADAKARLYAYEIPPMPPGEYEIITTQEVKSGKDTEKLVSTQPVTVKACQPYAIASDLIHSFYPPNLRTVSATTLPHVVLKGATPWERSQTYNPGTAPTPWIALLLFTDEDLCVPAEVTSAARPSGTRSFTLPLSLFNSNRSKFCHKNDYSDSEVPSKGDGSPATADFLFVKSSAFKMYFERQDSTGKTNQQVGPDLDRYKLLTYITDSGVKDDSGHVTNKLSTLIGHRARPYTLGDQPVKVYAHIVSIETLDGRIDWKAASEASATVALVSLFSWTFTWEKNNASQSLEMFKHLADQKNIRPLAIKLPPTDPNKPDDASAVWVRRRVTEGYTIVRHRDIAGESSMALYRGPLIPGSSRKARIKPSVHGTDLQIIDTSARILDISYNTAWELGRTLAGRDAKFSTAIAYLRRKMCMKAVTESKDAESEDATIMHKASDVVSSTLSRLDELFKGSVAAKMTGLPRNGEKSTNSARWQVPSHTATSMAAAPGVMTLAKLQRHLESTAKPWLEEKTLELCQPEPKLSSIPQLALVINWLIDNLMSLKLVPATYLFPDPAVLAKESVNCFLVDDTWVDALVDGAMSLANTMGGGDDPVRDLIRWAFNLYLEKAPADRVQIGGSGFIIRSGIVESFPDLEMTITGKLSGSNATTPLSCAYRTRNEDMILCLVARGQGQKLVDYTVKLKLPPHQQRYSLGMVDKDFMYFACEMKPFLKMTDKFKDALPLDEVEKNIQWSRTGVVRPSGLPIKPIWNHDTGILTPHLVVNMMDYFIDQNKTRTWDRPAADSKVIYLATQLLERDHCVTLNFNITAGKESLPRRIFPEQLTPEEDTRDPAIEHLPQSTETKDRSWFTKLAFSQDSPGRSIPAQSNTPQHIVFSVKINTSAKNLPAGTEVFAIEVTIPIGEDPSHLLDHLAPLPSVRAIGPRQQWIAATTHRKSAAEMVVHLKPRGTAGGGATLAEGLDASFMLVRATVNGVVGNDVEINTKEVYGRWERSKDAAGKEVPVLVKTDVMDKWTLRKE